MRNIYKYISINLLLLVIGVPLSATFLKFGFILLGHFTSWDSYNNHLAFTLISLIGAGFLSGALQNKLTRLPANIWLALVPVVTLLCASCLVELLLLYAANAEFESDLFLLYYTIYPAFSLCLFPFEEQMGDPVALRAIIPLMPAVGWLCFMLTQVWRCHRMPDYRSIIFILFWPSVLAIAVLILLTSQFYDRQRRLIVEDPAVMVSVNRQDEKFTAGHQWLIHANWPRVSGDPLFRNFVSGLYRNLPDGDMDAWYYNDPDGQEPDWKSLMIGERDVIFIPPLTKGQRQEAVSRGIALNVIPVARDILVFVTHPDNPVDRLSTRQIQAIYAGEINNWHDVGGITTNIWPYQHPRQDDEDVELQKMMINNVMQGRTMRRALETRVDEGMYGLIRRRANFQNRPESLGYFWRSDIMRSNKIGKVKMLAVDNAEPDNLLDCQRRYPFVSDIWLVTTTSHSRETQRLINAIISKQGQSWIARQGYIPLSPCAKDAF